jgi:AAA domain
LSVKINDAGDDIVVNTFADGDDPITCKDFVREKLGLPAWNARRRNGNGLPTLSIGQIANIRKAPEPNATAAKADPPKRGKLVARYDYTDRSGKLLYAVERYEDPKGFRQCRPDGKGGWRYSNVFEGVQRVAYRWPELTADMDKFTDAPIFVTEGEKDCDAVRDLGLTATTCAGSVWPDEVAALFKDHDIFVLEDNDAAGRTKSADVAGKLHQAGARVRIASFSDLAEKSDVSDWINIDPREHNAEALIERVRELPIWERDEEKAEAPRTDEKPAEASPQPSDTIPGLGEWDSGDDIALPPPRHWLLANQFCRRFLSGLLAPGATGKTALRTLQALSLATGRDLCGQHVFKRCRVLMVSLEDDKEELRRRVLAACMHHDIDLAERKGWLFLAAPKGFKLAEVNNKGARQIGILEKMLRETIERRKPDLVMLDPFIKLHALEENDNGAMDFVCDLLVQLAIEYDIAVDAPHHTKKGQLTPGDADAGRGASAARDAGRLIYTLTRMSEDEAKTFNVRMEDRPRYVRLDSGKVNTAPPSGEASWFKLIGVLLGNGNADYPSGDEVQTVIRWQPPRTWDGLSSAQLNAALTEIDAGLPNGQRYSDASRASSRAAWSIVQRHCPNRTEKQCREIIATWTQNGVLEGRDYDDPIDRKPRKGLFVNASKRPE